MCDLRSRHFSFLDSFRSGGTFFSRVTLSVAKNARKPDTSFPSAVVRYICVLICASRQFHALNIYIVSNLFQGTIGTYIQTIVKDMGKIANIFYCSQMYLAPPDMP